VLYVSARKVIELPSFFSSMTNRHTVPVVGPVGRELQRLDSDNEIRTRRRLKDSWIQANWAVFQIRFWDSGGIARPSFAFFPADAPPVQRGRPEEKRRKDVKWGWFFSLSAESLGKSLIRDDYMDQVD
jgi:hypothetical protein